MKISVKCQNLGLLLTESSMRTANQCRTNMDTHQVGLESCDVTPVTSHSVLSENNGLDISVTKVGFRWIISTSSTAGTLLWSTMMLVSPLSWRHTERMKDCLKLSAFLWQTSWTKPLSLLEPMLMEIHMVNIYIQYLTELSTPFTFM